MKNFLRGILWAWRSRSAKSEKQVILATLYRVKFAAFKTLGICGEFNLRYDGCGNIREEFRRLFRLWPRCSGDTVYPVPGGHEAFWFAIRYGSMWSGKYGKLRKELLNFMIEQLEKELAE